MIPKECKRLAEVDFPIAVVSKHSAREKSIRHGHPSTLHLWWARRPLAACRSMLLALLLPDPCDPKCPADFKAKARALLPTAPGHNTAKLTALLKTDEGLRTALLAFIGDFANWDNAGLAGYLDVSRGLVKAAHPEETPLVVDPFAGGGSIPLEALRIGCDAFASDLNPVACLINKVLLEDIPRHGPELAEELRKVGAEVKKAAEKELAEFYPRDPDGARPIAYLWARTVQCEQAGCGSEIPLVRSFWLCKKAERRRALRVKDEAKLKPGDAVTFEIFTPASEKEVRGGTVSRAKATCLCCKKTLIPDRVRAQLAAQRGGADVVFDDHGQRKGGARLLAVVTLKDGQSGRQYRLPTDADYAAVWKAHRAVLPLFKETIATGASLIPDELVDEWHHDVDRMPMYGMRRWGDLFTSRQLLTTNWLRQTLAANQKDNSSVLDLARLGISRRTDISNALCPWSAGASQVVHLFGRQVIPMLWDFAESCPLGEQAGDYEVTVGTMARVIRSIPLMESAGQVQMADARNSPIPSESTSVWFTDPPYYDAIGYSHCSDFFFVWLKRLMLGSNLIGDALKSSDSLTPKVNEIVVDSTTTKGHGVRTPAYYESSMSIAFAEGRRLLKDDGIGSVVFAHKTTEGWEALLNGMIRGGWTITASWPIATERPGRLRSQDSAALATSVHLVCRPRPEDAPVGDWAQVLRELPRRVADWMKRLQDEGVRGADLVFACIGPALEVYSRYSQVVDAEEREIPLGGNPEASEPHERGFLAYVWEVVGRAALEQVLGTSGTQTAALEEDARLTALFLWTLQTTDMEADKADSDEEEDESDDEEETASTSKKKKKGFSLPFDVVRRFAQPLGIHLDAWAGRCLETEKGIVRLIPVLDRAEQLFGEDGADAVAERLEKHKSGSGTQNLFAAFETPEPPKVKSKGRRLKPGAGESDQPVQHRGATTLDHVHAAMLLQSSGRANALRALLKSEIERGPDFLRLANALSALYPPGSDEKRLVDAMLLAVPR